MPRQMNTSNTPAWSRAAPTLACALMLALTPLAPRTAHADAAPFKLFDGHLHPISDDTQRYPRVAAQGAGGPPGPPSGPPPGMTGAPNGLPGGLPPGVGGQPGGINSAARAETDFDKRALKWMDEEGVEAAAAVQKRGTYGTDNSYTLDISEAHKGRLIGVVILDAQDAQAPAQLRDMIKTRGAAGIRLTGALGSDGRYPWLSSPQALKVWDVVNEAGAVMDIMITNQDNTQHGVTEIVKLAKAYPNVRLVLDHALYPKTEGAPDYGINATYASMAKQKNIYYKFSTINLDILQEGKVPAPDFVRRLVDVYGADHVLWGSDAGNTAGSYKELVGRIVAASTKLSAAEKRQVLHDTGKAVFVRGSTQEAAAVRAPAAALALEAVQAAIAACKANGYNEVAASVIDSSGELRVMMAADGTPPGHAVPRSARKAAAALAYKTSSAAVQARTSADQSFAAEIDANPKLLARAGGQPLISGGEVIGAIGVSGAPGGDKDDACALAGVARIKARL